MALIGGTDATIVEKWLLDTKGFEGPLKGLAKQIKQQERYEKQLEVVRKELDKATGKASQSTEKLATSTEKLSKASKSTSTSMYGMVSTIDKGVGAGSLLATGLTYAKDAMVELVKETNAYSQASNIYTGNLSQARKNTQGLASDLDIMVAKNKMMALGVSITDDEFNQLLGNLTKLSGAMNIDMKFALESATTMLARQSTAVADNVGVIIRAEDVYKDYANQLGKTVDELTNAEKKFAFQREAIEQLNVKAGELPDRAITFIDLTKKSFTNFANDVIEMSSMINKSLGSLFSSEKKEPSRVQALRDEISINSKAMENQQREVDRWNVAYERYAQKNTSATLENSSQLQEYQRRISASSQAMERMRRKVATLNDQINKAKVWENEKRKSGEYLKNVEKINRELAIFGGKKEEYDITTGKKIVTQSNWGDAEKATALKQNKGYKTYKGRDYEKEARDAKRREKELFEKTGTQELAWATGYLARQKELKIIEGERYNLQSDSKNLWDDWKNSMVGGNAKSKGNVFESLGPKDQLEMAKDMMANMDPKILFDPMNDALLRQIDSVLMANDAWFQFKTGVVDSASQIGGIALGGLADLTGGVWEAADAAIQGGMSFEQAMKGMTKSLLLSIAKEATVQAIMETAFGLKDLAFFNYPSATKHFASAATFGVAAVAAGSAGLAMSSAGWGKAPKKESKSKSSNSSSNSTKPSFGQKKEKDAAPIYVNVYFGEADDPTAALMMTKQIQTQIQKAA